MTYTTTPGTIPHRVVEHLKAQPSGTSISTCELADALGVEKYGITTTLQTAVRAGVLKSQSKPGDKRLLYWSLGDGVAQPPSADPDDNDDWPPAKPLVGIPKVASSPFQTVPLEPSELAPFRVGEFSDGSMVIETVSGTLKLVPEHARQLRDFVARRECAA